METDGQYLDQIYIDSKTYLCKVLFTSVSYLMPVLRCLADLFPFLCNFILPPQYCYLTSLVSYFTDSACSVLMV